MPHCSTAAMHMWPISSSSSSRAAYEPQPANQIGVEQQHTSFQARSRSNKQDQMQAAMRACWSGAPNLRGG